MPTIHHRKCGKKNHSARLSLEKKTLTKVNTNLSSPRFAYETNKIQGSVLS